MYVYTRVELTSFFLFAFIFERPRATLYREYYIR